MVGREINKGNEMPYSAKAVANTFLEFAETEGRTLTNTKLQRLVFLAHGFHLGINGEDFPLVREAFVASDEGPVVPELDSALRLCAVTPCGKLEVDAANGPDVIPEGSPERKVVRHVWDFLKDQSASYLSEVTRDSNSVWKNARRKSANYPISTEAITDLFKAVWNSIGDSSVPTVRQAA
jgi:uncharacterized phage-associated protein